MCLQGEAERQQSLGASSLRIHPRQTYDYWLMAGGKALNESLPKQVAFNGQATQLEMPRAWTYQNGSLTSVSRLWPTPEMWNSCLLSLNSLQWVVLKC